MKTTALNFPGSPWDYVELPQSKIASIGGISRAMTVETWAYIQSTGRQDMSLCVQGEAQKEYGKGIWISSGYLHWPSTQGSAGRSTYKPTFGSWTHLAITADVSSMLLRYYANGSLVQAKTFVPVKFNDYLLHVSAYPFFVGGCWPTWGIAVQANSVPFKGMLTETRIWDYVRTPEQLAANYKVQIDAAPGLVACWRGLKDYSGHGLNLVKEHLYYHKDQAPPLAPSAASEVVVDIPFESEPIVVDPDPVVVKPVEILGINEISKLFRGQTVQMKTVILSPDEVIKKASTL